MSNIDDLLRVASKYVTDKDNLRKFDRDIRRSLGGEVLYIAKDYNLNEDKIRRAYNGKNFDVLRRRYGVTSEQFQRIIKY